MEDNIKITFCKNCNSKLVHESLMKYFDKEENYAPETKGYTLGGDESLINLFSNILKCICDSLIVSVMGR